MKIMKIRKYLFDKEYRFNVNSGLGFYNKWDDEAFLKKAFNVKMGYSLNLDNPQTFNEKLQWLKLYNRHPEYTMMVDKYKVREYIADKLGEEYLIPLLGVWDDPDDIDFEALPNQFVLKCNHNSGTGMCICRDKSKLDIKKVKRELRKGLKENYYLKWREWPYKDVPRKIIAEKYMEDTSSSELNDYKFICFNGKVICSIVCSDCFDKDGLKVTFYNRDWEKIPFTRHYSVSEKEIQRHAIYQDVLDFLERLSKDTSFKRTDFYEIDERLYFVELTFFQGSGYEEFDSEKWDTTLGNWVKLPDKFGGYLLNGDNVCIWLHGQIIEQEHSLVDYKFFCFNGEPKFMYVSKDNASQAYTDFYDMSGNKLDMQMKDPASPTGYDLPVNFDKMKEFSQILSENIPFLRVDFYEINKMLYSGELTFFHNAGFTSVKPEHWNIEMGNWIYLPVKNSGGGIKD